MMRQQKYNIWKKHEENMAHLENSHLESRDGGLFLLIALFQFSANLSQCNCPTWKLNVKILVTFQVLDL